MPGLVMPGCCVSARIFASPKSTHFDEVAARAHRLQDDVFRLEIAVDDVLVVRLGQRRQRLAQHVDDSPEGQRSVFVRGAREVAPAQELHHQVELAVGRVSEVDDAHGVRVIQLACGAGLRDEPGGRVLLPHQMGVDDLHRDGASEGGLLGAIDAPHTADADELEDKIAARKRASDERIIGAGGDLADRESARRTEPMGVVADGCALGTSPHRLFAARLGTRLPRWSAVRWRCNRPETIPMA